MGKLAEKKQLKRVTILNAAQTVFFSDGYVKANMDKIASIAGVTKQTLYRYFASKEALFTAFLNHHREESRASFLSHLQQGMDEDGRELLLRFAKEFLEVHLSENSLALARLLIAESQHSPEMAATHFLTGPKIVEQQLRQFLGERYECSDLEYAVKMFVSTLLSLRSNLLAGFQTVPSDDQLSIHAERTIDLLMRLLEAK